MKIHFVSNKKWLMQVEICFAGAAERAVAICQILSSAVLFAFK